MSPALGEPPDSGVIASANALPANRSRRPRTARRAIARAPARRVGRTGAKGAGILFTGRVAKAPGAGRSVAFEHRRAALPEGGHALVEVPRGGESLLDLGLEVELAGHVHVQPPVELALDARVRARRAAG